MLESGVEGPPLWTTSGPPVVGRSFSLRVSNGTPGGTGFLGWSLRHDPRPVPYALGLVHPARPMVLEPLVLDGRGNSAELLRSPPVPPEYCGIEVFAQAGILGTGGVTLTNGLHLRVGGPSVAPFTLPSVALAEADLFPFDMDRDGLTDLVARQLYPDPILIGEVLQQYLLLRNLGDGTFAPGPTTLTEAVRARFLVADFDGDGFGDVATAGILLTGDAEPRLTVRGSTFAPGLHDPRAAGDLDSDGDLDLVGFHFTGLATTLNRGGGNFVPGPTFPVAVGWVALGHFDADRTLDAVVAHHSSPEIAVLAGNGDGSFRSIANLVTPGVVTVLHARDLDGDGFEDLVYATTGARQILVQRGLGSGLFDLAVAHPLRDTQATLVDLVLLDLDGDGLDDLATNRGESVLLGHGDGTFAAPLQYGIWSGQPASFLDLDQDGRLDLLAGDGTVHLGQGRGLMDAPRRPVAGLSEGQDIAAGDLDGDGLDDLVVPDVGTGRVLVAHTGERAVFAAPVAVSVGGAPNRVALGDLDGDGDLDAAVGHASADALTLLAGDGTGSLDDVTTHPMGGSISELALADLDADGDLDLIAAHSASGAGFTVALGNGDGTFQPGLTRAIAGESLAVVAGRFLGSADVDVVVLRKLTSNHAVLRFPGNGDGTFAAPASTATTHGISFVLPLHMTAADGDLDGDPDLFLSAFDGTNGYELLWRTNANGSFTRQSRTLRGVQQHAVADFSGDGLPDLVATSHGSSSFFGVGLGLHFFAGDGSGSFPVGDALVPLGNRSGPIAIGDFDRNGTPDVAVVNTVSRDVWVSLNRLGLGR